MPTLKRVMVQLTEQQIAELKERSYDADVSIAELVRRAVDALLKRKHAM